MITGRLNRSPRDGNWNQTARASPTTLGQGIGTLRMIGANPKRKKARPLATFPLAQIKRVRLVKRAGGFSAQFAVKTERQMAPEPTGKPVGIDVGLKAFYTDSDGTTVETPGICAKPKRSARASIGASRGKSKGPGTARKRSRNLPGGI